MKVNYDEQRMTILMEGLGRYFGNSCLIAESDPEDLNTVVIKYQDSGTNEVAMPYSQFEKSDGSPAGNNVTEVIDYLNQEFSKGMEVRNATFNGTNDEVEFLNPNITVGNVDIFVAPPININLNERVFVKSISNGSVIFKRALIDVLQSFSSGPTFKFIIFRR